MAIDTAARGSTESDLWLVTAFAWGGKVLTFQQEIGLSMIESVAV